MSDIAGNSALTYARVQVAAAARRGKIPERDGLTREWVIAELEHAGRTLQSLPARGTRPAGYGSGWPDIVRAAEEAYGWTADLARPAAPSAEDIARMDRAYAWIGLVQEGRRVWRRLLMMRSLVDPITGKHLWSWRKIGSTIGWSHEYARLQYDYAISDLVSRLVRECQRN